ncbi:MAG: hypothetical protein AAFX05_09330, partial [Planctomycetota bacterium]
AGVSESAALDGRAVNIGCGVRTTILQLFNAIAELMGKAGTEPTLADPRAGDVPHSLANITAAREILGYEPIEDLHSGLGSTITALTGRQPQGTGGTGEVVSGCH